MIFNFRAVFDVNKATMSTVLFAPPISTLLTASQAKTKRQPKRLEITQFKLIFWLKSDSESNMKDVIDVMQNQRQRRATGPVVDYTGNKSHYLAVRFLFECGLKLNAKPLTMATAAVTYHRFFAEADDNSYDCYLIAGSCIFLAGKAHDEPLKVRDVINVTHRTLHKDTQPIELDEDYWRMRDALVQAELLIMRMLKFSILWSHPHKFMLHYLKTLQDWFDPAQWEKLPIARAAASFLQDLHHDPAIIEMKPQHIAIACINLALQCYGAHVPLVDEEESVTWYSPFSRDLQKDQLWSIMERIMEVYNKESELIS